MNGDQTANFGAYLSKRSTLTTSFSPRDSHEAQVKFAMGTGVRAFIVVHGSIHSRSFGTARSCFLFLYPLGANGEKNDVVFSSMLGNYSFLACLWYNIFFGIIFSILGLGIHDLFIAQSSLSTSTLPGLLQDETNSCETRLKYLAINRSLFICLLMPVLRLVIFRISFSLIFFAFEGENFLLR